MTIGQGATLAIKPNMLSAEDADTDINTLTFITTNITNGIFDSIFNPGVPLSQFTQSQVINNMIRFVHDNSLLAPSYQTSVSDSTMQIPFQSANVTFDIAPVLGSNQLSIGQGQTIVLNSAMLNATDADNAASSLLFKCINVQHGQFVLSADTSIVVTQFSQSDIINKAIAFVHDKTAIAPGYQISVDDSIVATQAQSAKVTFYRIPTLVARSLIVNQGDTITLTLAMLKAASTLNDPNNLIFTVSKVEHGKFCFISNPKVIITSFTQQKIIDSQVQFIHDNTQLEPSALISITDGFVTMPTAELLFSFNAMPILTSNQLTLNQNDRLIINSGMLRATDKDSNIDTLSFKISELSNGGFWLKNNQSEEMTSSFLQQQIAANLVSFQHDDSAFAPNYKVSVSDGILSTVPSVAAIAFTKNATNNNTVIGAASGAGASGIISVGIWLFKKYIDSRSKKQFAGKSFNDHLCQAIIERVKVSGCLGYMNEDLIQDFRLAVNHVIKSLLDLGIGNNFNKLHPDEQKKLARTVALQIEKILLPERTCRNKFARFFKDFCVAEISIDSIITSANVIAEEVKAECATTTTERDKKSIASVDEAIAKSNRSQSIEMITLRDAKKDEAKLELELQSTYEEGIEAVRKIDAINESLQTKLNSLRAKNSSTTSNVFQGVKTTAESSPRNKLADFKV